MTVAFFVTIVMLILGAIQFFGSSYKSETNAITSENTDDINLDSAISGLSLVIGDKVKMRNGKTYKIERRNNNNSFTCTELTSRNQTVLSITSNDYFVFKDNILVHKDYYLKHKPMNQRKYNQINEHVEFSKPKTSNQSNKNTKNSTQRTSNPSEKIVKNSEQKTSNQPINYAKKSKQKPANKISKNSKRSHIQPKDLKIADTIRLKDNLDYVIKDIISSDSGKNYNIILQGLSDGKEKKKLEAYFTRYKLEDGVYVPIVKGEIPVHNKTEKIDQDVKVQSNKTKRNYVSPDIQTNKKINGTNQNNKGASLTSNNSNLTIKSEEVEQMIGKAVSLVNFEFLGNYRFTMPRVMSGIGVIIDIVRSPLKKDVELIVKTNQGYEQVPLERVQRINLEFWQNKWRSDVLPSILERDKEEDFYKNVYKNVDRSIKPKRYLAAEKMIGNPVFVKNNVYSQGIGIVVDVFGWYQDYMVEYDFPLKDDVGLAIITSDVIYPFTLKQVESINLKHEKVTVASILN